LDYKLTLPKICVVGQPSSGKSSIINALTGVDLLPKGESIITRRPIEFKMNHIPSNNKVKPYCELFLDGCTKEGRYEDFSQARRIIGDYMKNKSPGDVVNNISYSKDPMKIHFYSNSCIDVTLVDLPGVTDSNKATKEIAYSYIRDESCVILYAINCSDENVQQILTSEWKNDTLLKFIKDVDEDLSRTVGVFTKIDIVNSPINSEIFQNIKKYLNDINDNDDDKNSNENFKAKRGYVAVKNLSSNDTTTSIANNVYIEKEYFKTHQSLKFAPSQNTSIDALSEKLKKIFFDDKDVKNEISKIYSQLKQSTQKCQNELSQFGVDYLIYTSESKHTYIASLINIFSDTLEKIFSSKMSKLEDNLMNHKLKEMYAEFLKGYLLNYNPSSKLENEQIIRILKLSEADRISGFPEADVIQNLLEDEIEILRDEVKNYLDSVNELVMTVLKDTTFKIFCRFPKLMDKIEELMNLFSDEVKILLKLFYLEFQKNEVYNRINI